VVAGLAILAALPYLRTVTLPPISDDYVQVWLGRHYAPADRWPALAEDALYRCRAISILLTYWTERVFGLNFLALNVSNLLVHVLNTLLVFALGAWRAIGWRLAGAAAAFFAIYEGHQEAVVWYAALPETTVFFFSVLAFLCWVLWIQGGSRWWLAGAFAAFLLALGSKESAVAVVGLALLPVWTERAPLRKWALPLAGLAATALVYTVLVFSAKTDHLHLNDGTFTLGPHFLLVLGNSFGRMLWVWGLLSLVALAVWRERGWARLVALAVAWAAIAFLPYSFITYMTRVPSRHTYLASLALAWIVGAALLALWSRAGSRRAWAVGTVAAVMLAHNCGWVWTRKYGQFAERARPTEELVEFVRQTEGPVYVHCFPYPVLVAMWAAEMRLGREVIPVTSLDHAHGPVFCRPAHGGETVASAVRK
jgi:hypothetical protein